MPTFDLEPLQRFATGQTSIRRPREFTFFSYNDHHELRRLSAESLTYYYPPIFQAPWGETSSIDLSAGFNTFIQRDDSIEEHLDGLLDTIQAYEETLIQQSKDEGGDIRDVRVKADLITWRGMMTKILTAAYDIFNEFEMNATLYQDTIYIEENFAYKQYSRAQEQRPNPRRGGSQSSQEMMQYWGYKFEVLSTLPRPWSECTRREIESRETLIVNNNAQFCSIVRTGIGTTSIILAGEVDAVLGEKPDDPNTPIAYVELKTTQEHNAHEHRELEKFERKLLRFWAQSFLLGVPKIAVGYRSARGDLLHVEEMDTQRIPQKVKASTRVWDGNISINVTAALLDFLKKTIVGEGVWRIRRVKSQKTIEVFRVADTGTGEIVKQSFRTHREKLRVMEVAAMLGEGGANANKEN